MLWMPSTGRVSKREEKARSLSMLFVLIPLYKPCEKSLLYPIVKKLPTGPWSSWLSLLFIARATPARWSSSESRSPEYHVRLPEGLVYCPAVSKKSEPACLNTWRRAQSFMECPPSCRRLACKAAAGTTGAEALGAAGAGGSDRTTPQ